ncbi:MAG: hypothetical protein EZS28_023552 [Streblomastix strix]|uniref:Uncharacterized protein n=1 Tax=Streblomastix strix TaxID=222440 RepID=A0A5J4VEP0_9EUKA|nr:MAG: hypothetical protein EZS28_023552 [Streblomastix strix]
MKFPTVLILSIVLFVLSGYTLLAVILSVSGVLLGPEDKKTFSDFISDPGLLSTAILFLGGVFIVIISSSTPKVRKD